MFRRLLNRIRRRPEAMVTGVNLVQEEAPILLAPPRNIGISETARTMAWTVARLDRIVRHAHAQPADAHRQLEARHARHCLSQFWLTAPLDQLESFYGGPVGQTYRLLLQGPLPAQPLAEDESRWKQSLVNQLSANFDAPERLNLLLAVMTYFAPRKMQISDPAENLPRWLLGDYISCFAPELASELGLPIGLLDEPRPSTGTQPATNAPSPSALPLQVATIPEPAPLPRLIPEGGDEVFPLFQDEEFVNRMTGLINLYIIDRDDSEVKLELARLRRLIGQIWLDVSSPSLEPLYRSNLGPVYRSLLASNFGAEPLDQQDQQICQDLAAAAMDMDHPAMAQALMAAMPFLPQGKMRLGPGQSRLPLWLQESFNSLAGVGG